MHTNDAESKREQPVGAMDGEDSQAPGDRCTVRQVFPTINIEHRR